MCNCYAIKFCKPDIRTSHDRRATAVTNLGVPEVWKGNLWVYVGLFSCCPSNFWGLCPIKSKEWYCIQIRAENHQIYPNLSKVFWIEFPWIPNARSVQTRGDAQEFGAIAGRWCYLALSGLHAKRHDVTQLLLHHWGSCDKTQAVCWCRCRRSQDWRGLPVFSCDSKGWKHDPG